MLLNKCTIILALSVDIVSHGWLQWIIVSVSLSVGSLYLPVCVTVCAERYNNGPFSLILAIFSFMSSIVNLF